MVAPGSACYIDVMVGSFFLGLSSLVALLPAAVFAVRENARGRDGVYWLLLAVAVVGQLAWAFTLFRDDWQTGFGAALWVSIAATVVLFAVSAGLTRQAWRLTALIMPYLAILGLLALSLKNATGRPLITADGGVWLAAHIAVSVTAYALLTIAAIAGLGVLLQERALKRKRPTAWTRILPSIADGESLQVGLLAICEVVLLVGILTGVATGYLATGTLISIDHKTLLSILAFVIVGLLLAAHYRAGIRGRGAARWILAAYLVLTLAYPGVKFVTDVIIA